GRPVLPRRGRVGARQAGPGARVVRYGGARDPARAGARGRRVRLTRVGPSTTELEAEVARLRARLAEHEQRAGAQTQQLERYAADLRETFKREREAAQELRRSYVATVRALSNAVEALDAYTGHHAERVAAYGLAIAAATGTELTHQPEIEFGFLLHDVGKVAIPDAILYKPEPLEPHEFRLMARHPVIGWEIVRDVAFLG